MQHPGTCVVLIPTLEVVLGVHPHIACGDEDILVVGNIHSGAVVHLVIGAGSYGEAGNRPLAVVEHSIDIRREHALVSVVDLNGRVGPPQESLRHLGPVVEHTFDFKISAAWTQRKACHSLLVEHTLHFINPDRDAAVGILLDGAIHRKISAGAVVLGPVEFNSAAYPRSGKPHEGGLDHVVIVYEMALLDFVVRHLHTSSKFGKYHHLDVLVLQIDGFVGVVRLLVCY